MRVHLALAAVAAILWGLVVAAPGFIGAVPILYLAGAVALIGGFFLAWFAPPPHPAAFWRLIPAAILLGPGTLLPLLFALEGGRPADALCAIAAAVVLAVLVASAVRGEGAGWPLFLAVPIALVGLALVAGLPAPSTAPMTIILLLAAAIAWAAGQALCAGARAEGTAIATFVLLLAAPLLLFASRAFEGTVPSLADAGPPAVRLDIIAVALVAGLMAHDLWFTAVRRTGLAATAPFLLLAPATALLVGPYWASGAMPDDLALIGGGLLVLALVVCATAAPRATAVAGAAPISDLDARAAATAYKEEVRIGGSHESAIAAAVMVYRIRNPQVSDAQARELLTRLIDEARDRDEDRTR